MLIKNLSAKTSDVLILAVVTLMYIALCAEADMYVPSFPQMVDYFSTSEDKIQLILSINFVGLCLASLVCGPLSDSIGRRKVLIGGLILFFISSLGCVWAEQFHTMLLWRFIQGMSAAVPMVVGCAVFLDKYSLEKASQLVGVLNSVITATMAGAPILGAYLSYHFHWRINFMIITLIVALSLIGTLLFIEETLPPNKRRTFKLLEVAKDYSVLLRSYQFIGYCLVALFPFIAVVVYISNLSLIFINHLGISPHDFGYYQATTMATFVIFSALSVKLIAKKGLDFTKNLGGLIVILGTTLLFITALINEASVSLICSSMSLVAAGGALMVSTFGMKALELFPDMKGTASALMTTLRQLLASALVFISELSFTGTIVPVACILFSYVVIAGIWYACMKKKGIILANSIQ